MFKNMNSILAAIIAGIGCEHWKRNEQVYDFLFTFSVKLLLSFESEWYFYNNDNLVSFFCVCINWYFVLMTSSVMGFQEDMFL